MPKKRANVSVGPVKPRQKQRMSSAKSTETTQRSGGAAGAFFFTRSLALFCSSVMTQQAQTRPLRKFLSHRSDVSVPDNGDEMIPYISLYMDL